MPRPENGAAPEVLMAIVESDVHHLREQADMDRRGVASRLAEDRARLERIEAAQAAGALQSARTADSVSSLERIAEAQAGTLSNVLKVMHRAQGSIGFLRWALGASVVLEGVRLFLEHAK